MSGLDPTVQVAVISGAFALLIALISMCGELVRRSHKTLHAVREQVQNSHSTNLRDDIDRIGSLVERVLEGQALDRRALLQLEERLDHHIEAPHAA